MIQIMSKKIILIFCAKIQNFFFCKVLVSSLRSQCCKMRLYACFSNTVYYVLQIVKKLLFFKLCCCTYLSWLEMKEMHLSLQKRWMHSKLDYSASHCFTSLFNFWQGLKNHVNLFLINFMAFSKCFTQDFQECKSFN